MNGEMVYGGHHSITLLSCSQSLSPARGEMMIKVTREGRCADRCSLQDDAPWQDDGGTRTIGLKAQDSEFAEREGGGYSQRSSSSSCCWSEGPSSTQQHHHHHHHSPSCLRSQAELPPLPLGNKTAPSPLLANNGTARRLANQRRGVRCKVKGKKSALRIAESRNSQNRKVTDYYPIRRSSRKSKAELKCEQKTHVDNLIINGIEEGMEVQNIVGKGRGVFTRQCFQKGQYVVEYHGDLLQVTDAQQREAEYAQNPATGCYMYYFQYACKTYCVDATRETGRMGRLINHSKNGNCQTKLHDINGVPHLILVASRDVEDGEELLYDYGDRSRASIAAHPWLKY